MKILGIGNAIIDVICKVEESFLTKNDLTKGTMKLVFDDKEFKNMLANLKIEKTVSGGSVANSIVGLSQLKNEVGFIGKISDDTFGKKYEDGLKEENVMQDYHYNDLGKTLSISVKAKRDIDSSPYLTCDNEYFQIIIKSTR